MSALSIKGGAALAGRVQVPPDKSIFHRAVFLSAIAEGEASISPLSFGADNLSSLRVMEQLGVEVELDHAADRARLVGRGHPRRFTPGPMELDCGNSGTTLRILCGLLAASGSTYRLTGDASLTGRPMSRLRPLEGMGAKIRGVERDGRLYPPLEVEGQPLVGGDFELAVASAQVKSALLLAGLFASGPTRVREPARSRDHTERMLRSLGVRLHEDADGWLILHPRTVGFERPRFLVPPDFSSAAFILAGALLTGSPEVWVRTGTNPTRTGFLDILRAFGAEVRTREEAEPGGEPVAEVSARADALRGAEIAGELTLRALDELPLVAALAAFAEGTTRIRDAAELRVKESDRLASTRALLEAFGARVTERPDGLEIEGQRERLRPTRVTPAEDHRLVMTAAVMGLGLYGETMVHGADIIAVSYPSFVADLRRLGAEVERVDAVSDPVR